MTANLSRVQCVNNEMIAHSVAGYANENSLCLRLDNYRPDNPQK